MTMIHVPRPPKSAFDPSRPVSGLLKAQMEHLHQAASKLPARYRSEVYVNAIKTEGEAGRYIREVTEAIHNAHQDAAAARVRSAPKRRRGIEIAAVADVGAERKLLLKAKKRGENKRIGEKKIGKKPARKS
jgi:hypothetical protein